MVNGSQRRPEFQLDTIIFEDHLGRHLVKQARFVEAKAFLETLPTKEKKARHFVAEKAEVVVGTHKHGKIYYRHLCKRSLEELVGDALAKPGDYGRELLEQYIEFVNGLQLIEIRPVQFMRYLGISQRDLLRPLFCLGVGLIDCVPQNILVGPHTWYLIDHEWLFDFPVPKDFIIFRGIIGVVEHLQEIIRRRISLKWPGVLFCGYGSNRLYIPKNWLDLLLRCEIPIRQLHYWEYLFQNKVLVEANRGHLRLRDIPITIYRYRQTPFAIDLLLGVSRKILWTSRRLIARSQFKPSEPRIEIDNT